MPALDVTGNLSGPHMSHRQYIWRLRLSSSAAWRNVSTNPLSARIGNVWVMVSPKLISGLLGLSRWLAEFIEAVMQVFYKKMR